MATNRTRREDPARTEPYRQWENLMKSGNHPDASNGGAQPGSADSGATNGADWHEQAADREPNGAATHTIDQTISDAVKLGYKIIEEQIDQGKRVAASLSGQTYSTNAISADTADFVKRLMRFYTDIGSSCFEFIETLSRNASTQPAHEESHREPPNQSGPGSHAPPGNHVPSTHNVPVEITSDVPTRVTVNLSGPVRYGRLGVQVLLALDMSSPPLHDVEFKKEQSQALPTLVIRIPKGQPEGRYTGTIIDFETNHPQGTLTIDIGRNTS
jgi:hypothetical protein